MCEACCVAIKLASGRSAGGAAACWTLDNLAPRVIVRDFAPGFMVDHFIKDMDIALDEAARTGLVLPPGLAPVHQLYLAVRAQSTGGVARTR